MSSHVTKNKNWLWQSDSTIYKSRFKKQGCIYDTISMHVLICFLN